MSYQKTRKKREEQRMNCCDFSIDDTAIKVKNKLVTAFPILADKDITFLQATKSGDLFKVKEQVTGDSIFKLTRMGSGCLYVTHPTPHHPPPANNSPTPTVVVLPKPRLPQHKGKFQVIIICVVE